MYGYYHKAGKSWEDAKLWEATKDNPQEDINIESFLNQDNYWNMGSFKEFAKEMQLVLKADYSYPIILDEKYKLVDGAHRLVHAYLDGKTSIKGVIIKNNQFPEPDYDEVKECQNRQKFIANVEPKFKMADWIVTGDGKAYQVISVEEYFDAYILVGCDGSVIRRSIQYIDKSASIFTIENAKDGDVLSYVADEGDLWIMIYRSLYKPYKNHVHYHALLINDNFSDIGTCCIDINNLKPATKEQRDLLFVKMKESGYEWNADEKVLNKVIIYES